MKLKNGLIINEIDGEYILIDLGSTKPVFNGMIKLNETAREIVTFLLENDATKNDLVLLLKSKYDVSEKDAKNDVNLLIKKLKQNNLILL